MKTRIVLCSAALVLMFILGALTLSAVSKHSALQQQFALQQQVDVQQQIALQQQAASEQPTVFPLRATEPTITPLESQQDEEIAWNLYSFVLNQVRQNFLWQDRLTNWPSVELVSGQLHSKQEAEDAVKAALAELKDQYSEYLNNDDTKIFIADQKKPDIVHGEMHAHKNACLKIDTFNNISADQQANGCLHKLQKAGGYIVDVRGNGGGAMEQGFSMFSLFVDEAPYAIVEGKEGGESYTDVLSVTRDGLLTTRNGQPWSLIAREPNLSGKKTVVILANGLTASASEMFINAMVENGRATVVGTKTFGKGIGQSIFQTPGGGYLKLTTMWIYTPKHLCIHGKGTIPQTVVENTEGHDEQMAAATQLLETNVNVKPIAHTASK